MGVCPFADQSRRYDHRYPGRYTGGPSKGCLHSTEGGSLPDYRGGATAPHFTTVPHVPSRSVRVFQHFDTSRPARALQNASGGVQTNGDSLIQIELVGTCDARMRSRLLYLPEAPHWYLDGIARLMRWVEQDRGIPRRSAVTWRSYNSGQAGGSYGARNGVRLSPAEFDGYAGWLGHQHVPENSHGDPGDIDIAYLLADTEDDDMTPDERRMLTEVHHELTHRLPNRAGPGNTNDGTTNGDTLLGYAANADGYGHRGERSLERLEAALVAQNALLNRLLERLPEVK